MAEQSNLNLKARLAELKKQGKENSSTYKKIVKLLAQKAPAQKQTSSTNVMFPLIKKATSSEGASKAAEDKAFKAKQGKELGNEKKAWIKMMRKRDPSKTYDEYSAIWDKNKKKN